MTERALACYATVEGKTPANMPGVLAETFTKTISEARAVPAHLVGPGYFAPMRADEFVASRIVEAVVHGIDLAQALGSPYFATADGIAMTAGHLAVPTGETAVLPWRYDRVGQPAARPAAAWHGAGLGARLPVRRMRTRAPALLVRTGLARADKAPRSAGAPQAGCRHPRPAGTGGEPV